KQYVAPRTAGEEILAEIWADVLGVDRVGVEDNFFELGGHSLTATVLLSRITKQFQLDVPLHAIFATPTVSGLAMIIEELLIEKLESLSEHEVEYLFNQNNSFVD
ncbi:MAG: phosphopantetheine-binding protein, partial [Methylobacter tundripaludum]|nr:phosphopantetheine-binding protein [Methylobacter tundripaludum]